MTQFLTWAVLVLMAFAKLWSLLQTGRKRGYI
jgi:hypothetical protein